MHQYMQGRCMKFLFDASHLCSTLRHILHHADPEIETVSEKECIRQNMYISYITLLDVYRIISTYSTIIFLKFQTWCPYMLDAWVFASPNAPTPSASHLPQLRIIDTQPRVVAFPNSDGWKSGKSRHAGSKQQTRPESRFSRPSD